MKKIIFFIKLFKNKITDNFDILKRRLFQKSDTPSLQNSLDKKLVFVLSRSRFPSFQQFKRLPQLLSPKEKLTIKALTGIILACLAFLGVNFYFGHIQTIPATAGEYTDGLVGGPQYINPLFSQANDVDADLVRLIFSGLLKYDNSVGEFKPDLAEKYEISDDKKTYIFYLRDNLVWQDGEPLTVDDIIFTVELAKLQKLKSPLGISLQEVSVEKINEKTVKFVLDKPYASSLAILSFGILPKHIWEDVNLNNINLAEYNLKPIGSGPYKVQSRIIDKEGNIRSYILTINDKYYSKKPYIETLTLNFFSGYNEAVEALKTRNIQGIGFVPVEFEEELKTKEHLNRFIFPMPQYVAVFFNQDNNDFLKDKNVRKALRSAINKKELIEQKIGDRAQVINSPLIEEWTYQQENSENFFDPEISKKILEKEGFTLNEETQFYQKEIKKSGKKEKKDLRISLTVINSDPHKEIAEKIKEYWEKIGVKTEINALDISEIKKNINERNYEALLYGEAVSFGYDLYPFWHSSQVKEGGLNLSSFKNKEADKLLEEVRFIDDKNKRKEIYAKFQKIIQEEVPAIFLYQPIYSYMIDKEIKGVDISFIFSPADRFSNISQWYIKTKKKFQF